MKKVDFGRAREGEKTFSRRKKANARAKKLFAQEKSKREGEKTSFRAGKKQTQGRWMTT